MDIILYKLTNKNVISKINNICLNKTVKQNSLRVLYFRIDNKIGTHTHIFKTLLKEDEIPNNKKQKQNQILFHENKISSYLD